MEYFKKMMRQFINWVQTDEAQIGSQIDSMATNYYGNGIAKAKNYYPVPGSIDGHNSGLNFTVYSATGGKVVQIRTYDPRSDISRSTLYVVTDKEDLGQELGHIITVESLSK